MTSPESIDCPSCGERLQIPTVDGVIRLTCPICTASWDWNAGTLINLHEEIAVRSSVAKAFLFLIPAVIFLGGGYLGVRENRLAAQ
jgi:uncharacterized paraquat-inducible protein A